MRTIYGRALCVRGWVGAPHKGAERDFDALFKTITKLTSAINHTSLWRRKRGLGRATSESNWSLAKLSDAELRRVDAAFRRITAEPYWERLWIIQEMAMAPSLVFWYGDAWFNGSRLRSMFEALRVEVTSRGWKYEHDRCKDTVNQYTIARELLDGEDKGKPVLAAFICTALLARSSKATDPRDKVYGMLGMLVSAISDKIKVDYSPETTAEEVYLHYTIAGMKAGGDPTMRALFEVSPAQLSGDGPPTWAIDLNGPLNDVGSVASGNWRRTSSPWQGGISEVHFSEDGRLLTQEGFLIDTITQVGTIMSDWYIKDARTMDVEDVGPACDTSLAPVSEPYPISKLSIARILFKDSRHVPLIDETFLDIPWYVIERIALTTNYTRKRAPLYTEPKGTMKEVDPKTAQSVPLKDYVKPVLDQAEHPYEHVCKMAWNNADFQIGGKRLRDWFESDADSSECSDLLQIKEGYKHVWHEGRMISSHSGLAGIGPTTARLGDQIAILGGNSLPVLLRPKGDTYQLIGACFVDGLMQGEVISWATRGVSRMRPITLC